MVSSGQGREQHSSTFQSKKFPIHQNDHFLFSLLISPHSHPYEWKLQAFHFTIFEKLWHSIEKPFPLSKSIRIWIYSLFSLLWFQRPVSSCVFWIFFILKNCTHASYSSVCLLCWVIRSRLNVFWMYHLRKKKRKKKSLPWSYISPNLSLYFSSPSNLLTVAVSISSHAHYLCQFTLSLLR